MQLFLQLVLQLFQLRQTVGLLLDLLLHSLGFLELAGVLLGLAHQHTDLFGQGVAVAAQLVGLGNSGAALGIQVNDLVHQGQLGVLELLLDVFTNSVGIFPDKTNVEHINSLLFCDSEYNRSMFHVKHGTYFSALASTASLSCCQRTAGEVRPTSLMAESLAGSPALSAS